MLALCQYILSPQHQGQLCPWCPGLAGPGCPPHIATNVVPIRASHGEADTRLVLHAVNIHFITIVISTRDTRYRCPFAVGCTFSPCQMWALVDDGWTKEEQEVHSYWQCTYEIANWYCKCITIILMTLEHILDVLFGTYFLWLYYRISHHAMQMQEGTYSLHRSMWLQKAGTWML